MNGTFKCCVSCGTHCASGYRVRTSCILRRLIYIVAGSKIVNRFPYVTVYKCFGGIHWFRGRSWLTGVIMIGMCGWLAPSIVLFVIQTFARSTRLLDDTQYLMKLEDDRIIYVTKKIITLPSFCSIRS